VSAKIPQGMAIIRNDLVHPPLYYFLLRAWLAIVGHVSPAALRAVSLVSGVAVVALIALAGFLFPEFRVTTFIAACFLAANNLHIFYSQQVRSYAFYTLLFACLLTWSWLIGRFGGRFAFWCLGTAVMSLLVYTHYVGSLYTACIIVAVTLSPVPRRAKFHVWIAGVVAACSFIPWILAELGPAHRHHGVQDNLSWESLPTVYDLKAIWANYLGIPAWHAATTGVLLIGCAHIVFGIFYCRSERSSFRRLFLLTLICTAFIPPCLLFVLSLKPISLPVFGARHLLPSIVSYLLLVAEGLVQLAHSFRARTIALVMGSTALLALELVPTSAAIANEPRRMPFREIAAATPAGLPLYTTWPYGIGGPMNFYEGGRNAVRDIPADTSQLPDDFVVIFRPGVPREEQTFERLTQMGWRDVENRDFYNGSHTGYFARAAYLRHERAKVESGL